MTVPAFAEDEPAFAEDVTAFAEDEPAFAEDVPAFADADTDTGAALVWGAEVAESESWVVVV